jgi:hypothetical protein
MGYGGFAMGYGLWAMGCDGEHACLQEQRFDTA